MTTARTIQAVLTHDRVVNTVIVFNSVVLIMSGFPQFRGEAAQLLFWLDYWYTVYFVLEFAFKVRLQGWSGYWASGWNRFDFSVIALSTPMLLAPLPFMGDDAELFGLVLLLRLGRVMRLMRLTRLIPDCDRIASGLARAFKASLGIVAALVIYNFILGVMASHMFHDIAPDFFGDPLISIYSMFKVFTVEGWFEIPDAIAGAADPVTGFFARLFFVFAVLTGGILGLSLANAVFVDEMVLDNTRELEEHLLAATGELRDRLETLQAQTEARYRELMARLDELSGPRG